MPPYTPGVLFRLRRSGDCDAGEACDAAQPGDARAEHEVQALDEPQQQTNGTMRLASLKGQSNARDARAERLVGGLRGELDQLRDELKGIRAATPGVYQVDVPALLESPGSAAGVPPRLLVKELARLSRRVNELEEQAAEREQTLAALRGERHELERQMAALEARNETLSQVIGALYGNLEDLRAARDGRASGTHDERRALPPERQG